MAPEPLPLVVQAGRVVIGLSRYELKLRQASSVSFSLFAWCIARSTLLLMIWTVADVPCRAASQDASLSEKPITFDIPAQPLASALEAYSAATGVEIFYDAILAAGHRSASVKGSFLPARALETLLVGTGYVPRSTGRDTISIAPGPQGTSQQTIASKQVFDRYQPYFSVLQAQLSRTLCHDDPGKLRSSETIFKFWLSTSGTIARAQIIASDGDADRDRALLQRAEGLEIGEPPPPGLPEPITMAVFPRMAGEAPGCPDNRDGSGGH